MAEEVGDKAPDGRRLRHIARTPYMKHSNEVVGVYYVGSGGTPGFAYHRAARSAPAALGPFPGRPASRAARCASGQATGAEPIPYESRKIRDEQAERIRTAEDLREDDRAMLLAHVARTPYLQTA